MKLKNRLLEISKLVKLNSIVIDVGCDHGLLSIYLTENNISSYVYATDVNIQPLNSAKNNILKHRLEDKIKVVLSDGLAGFENVQFDCVIIAGMGGSLIIEILDKHLDLIKDKQLILQPNINDHGLRKYLINNNLIISNDYLVKENDIIYDIIEVDNINKDIDNYLEVDYLLGLYNIKRNDTLIVEKLDALINKYKDILSKISKDSAKFIEYNKMLKELVVKKHELE